MKSNQQNFHPLRFIRIAKDIKQNEFSKYFSCSPAYISSVENGKRKMTLRILKSGLNELGISLEDYFELEELGNYLVTSETEKEIIYRCMLAKSIGIIRPDLKKDAEQLIVEFLEIHNKKKSRKGGFDA